MLKKIAYLALFNCLIISQLNAQTTKKNYTGIWTNNDSWIGNSNPGVTSISSTITINGFITHNGDLNFSNGKLVINDTLILYNGTLVFENLAGGGSDPTLVDISIGAGGILIVFGDLITGNKVDLDTKGKLVVTGQLAAQGGSNTEYIDSGGEIFLFNPPAVNGGGSFEPLKCPDPPTSYNSGCNYGDLVDAYSSSVAPLLGTGGFSLNPSGNIELTCGDSIELSAQSGADLYSWYKDSILIDSGISESFYAKEVGDYYLEITVGDYIWSTTAINVSIDDIIPPSITCPQSLNICYGETIVIGTPTVIDNCEIDYVSNNAPENYSNGSTIVKWVVYDIAGNNSSCEQIITIDTNTNTGELLRFPND